MKNNEWEATQAELYAEKWWRSHGFSVTLDSRMLSKSVYIVSKDGIKDKYEVPFRVKDKAGFMRLFEHYWALLKKTKEAGT